jgi:phosphohistidine phosphatase
MDIFLLRHGIAEERSLEIPDASRKLTPKGEKQLRRVLAVAKNAGVEPELILTSPLRRAQETAAVASEVLGCSRVRETRALLPEEEPESVWVELQELELSSVLLAGHEPHMSAMLSYILGVPLQVDFKKGALVCVDARISGASLKWMLTPRLTRA